VRGLSPECVLGTVEVVSLRRLVGTAAASTELSSKSERGYSERPARSVCLQCVTVYHRLLFDAAAHVEAVQSVEAENDDAAKAYAASVGRIHAVEVWQGQRRLYRVQNPPQ
jgi:hypothetical protein